MHESNSFNSSISMDAVPASPETQPGAKHEMAEAVGGSCSSVQPTETSDNMDIVKAVAKATSETLQTEVSIFSKNMESIEMDLRIQNYIKMGFMSYELKFGFKDAMILCCDKDISDVKEFRDSLESGLSLNNQENPQIVLFSEIANSLGSVIRSLEFGLERCTFVFLYISSSFVTDAWSEFSSETCLMEAIHNPKRRWSVVPVFSEDRRSASFKIPISINTLKGLHYSLSDKFYKDAVQKLFDDRINVRRLKEREHKKKQRQWVYDFEDKARIEEIDKMKEAIAEKKKKEAFSIQKAILENQLASSTVTFTNPDQIPCLSQASSNKQVRNDMINEYNAIHNPHSDQSSPNNKSFKIPEKNEQLSLKTATENTEDSKAISSAMEATSISQPADVPFNQNADAESRTSILHDDGNYIEHDFSSSVDPDDQIHSFGTDISSPDVEVDVPSADGVSDPRNKNTARVVEIHHHHHHYDPPVYHVTAKNVQIGEGNNMVSRHLKNDLGENLSDDECEDNGETEDGGDTEKQDFSVLENYGISPHSVKLSDDAQQTAVKEIDTSNTNS